MGLKNLFAVICLMGTSLSLLHGTGVHYVQTLVGGNLNFIPEKWTCSNSSQGLLVHLSPGNPRDVAKLEGGQWIPMSGFETRLTPGGAMEFKEATINDHGMYELACSSIGKMALQVDVLVPYVVHATVGQSTTLPCHFNTRAQAVKAVLWEDGAQGVVMEHWFEPNKTKCGEKFKHRVTMVHDAYSRGDLSLRLDSVQLQDQDQFFCKVKSSGSDQYDMDPSAIQLYVSNTQLKDQLLCDCSSDTTKSHYGDTIRLQIVIFGLSAFVSMYMLL